MKLKLSLIITIIISTVSSYAGKPEEMILNSLLREINSDALNSNIRILKKLNKFIVLPPKVPSVDFRASAAEKIAGLALFARPAAKPVTYNTLPTQSELKQPMKLFGAKNSVSQALLGILPLADKQQPQVILSPLTTAAGQVFPASAIKLYKVRHLFVTTGQYIYRPVPLGLAPLANGSTLTLNRNICESILLEAQIPVHVAAGTYRGTLTVGKSSKRVELQVMNFTLMQVPPLRMNWGFYVSDKVGSRDFKFMAEHGCNTVVIAPGIDHKFTERLKQIRQAGLNGILLIDVGALDKYIQAVRYSPSWRRQYLELVKKFALLMQRQHEQDSFIGLIHDEPRETNLNPWNRTYKQTMLYFKLIGQAAPGMKRGVNPMFDQVSQAYPKGLYTKFVDKFEMIMPHYWAKCRNIIDAAQRNPRCQLWSYNDGDNRLAWGLHSWKVGLHGRTQYHYRPYSPHEHPLSPIFMGNSEFEGRSFTGNYVIAWRDRLWSTVKLNAMRDGIIDYRYLYTLEQLIKRHKSSPAASAAQAYLQKLKLRIPEYAHAASFTKATEAGSGEVKTSLDLDRIRRKIADYCEALDR